MKKVRSESTLFLSLLILASLMALFVQTPQAQGQAVNWNSLANVAWRYYQPTPTGCVSSTTGLHYGTCDWHYITDWDTGNYLIAILEAQSLGLIQKTGDWGADYRLGRVLDWLKTRELRPSDGLPYWAYNSDTRAPAGPTEVSRQVTDVADTARLLVALYVVKTRRPDLASQVGAILSRPAPPPTGPPLGSVYNNAFIQGKAYSGFYGYYCALAYARFPEYFPSVQTSQMDQLKSGAHIDVYGQQLPVTDVTTEPFLNGILEIPSLVGDTFYNYAYRVLEAQRGRWLATGYLTGWSEGASDVAPFYLYEWIVHTTGESSPVPWKLVLPSQSDINSTRLPIMYTKVAIALHAIFRTDYTETLVNAVLGKVESDYGFREGIREKTGEVIGIPGWPIQDKANSLILSAARYALGATVVGSLHVTTMPLIQVPVSWNSTNLGTTDFNIRHDVPFTVLALTAPASVSVSGVNYYFNHWELDGEALEPPSNGVASISVGGTQPSARAAIAYYLPTAPLSDTVSQIFSAPLKTVHFIGNSNPYDNQAMLGAWAKTTYQQEIGLWSAPSGWVDQTTGRPLVAGNLVLLAGPLANRVVGYYASRGLTPGFRWSNGYAQIVLGDHVLAQMLESEIGSGKDIFVAHVFRDGDRLVFVLWGIGAQGTLASGVWLVNHFSSLQSMTNGLYVYQWTDNNNDTFPQPEEITVILYQGN